MKRIVTLVIAAIVLAIPNLASAQTFTPAVEIVFHNASGHTVYVQLIGQGGSYNEDHLSNGATFTANFKPNPAIMHVQVSGCVPNKQLFIQEFYTRTYSKVEFTYAPTCKFSQDASTP